MTCLNDTIKRAITDGKENGRYAYIAPLYSQAKSVAFDYLMRYTAPIRTHHNIAELWVQLLNGSRVRLFGADSPDSLRGMYLDGATLDEYAQMRPGVWGEIVRPMLADRRGWATFIGTPKGHNAFWDIWEHAKRDPDWFSLMLRASESGLLDADELADARLTMSADQYAQEFECSFDAAIIGAYYGEEMAQCSREGRIGPVTWDRELKVYTYWDLGYTDDTAIVFAQHVAGEVRVIDHYAAAGKPVVHYVDLLRSKPYRYGKHWLPHDARAKTLSSGGRSTIEQLGEHLGIENMGIVPQLSVQDGIQAARFMFPRVWFNEETCDDLIECLRQYQREFDDRTQAFKASPRHDWTSHSADAFRYLAVGWREDYAPQAPVKPRWPVEGVHEGRIQIAPLNDLWRDSRSRKDRI